MSRRMEEKFWIWEKIYSGELGSGDWPVVGRGIVEKVIALYLVR